MSLGNRVLQRPHPIDPELLEALRGLRSADVSNAANRLYSVGPEILPRTKTRSMVGFALTVRVPPADNLFVLAALEMAEPGDVIVVDCGGDRSAAMLGELVADHAQHRKISGFVIDGAIRDVSHLANIPLPIFAAAVTNRGASKAGPGEINVPVVCGRMAVSPGDVVIGDEDGVICVPRAQANELITAVKKREAREAQFRKMVDAGKFGERIAEMVRDAGYGPKA